MCGIAGIVKLHNDKIVPSKILSRSLLDGIMSRGTDSTGIYSNGIIKKSAVSAKHFRLPEESEFGPVTLLHTRWATRGKPEDNNNNHPVESKDWVIIHNGTVSMPRIETYDYKGEVDTEILISYIQELGIEEAIEKIRGSAAFAAYNKTEDILYLYAWNNPIHFGYIPGNAIIWASEAKFVREAVKEAYSRYLGHFLPVVPKKVDECDLWIIKRTESGELDIDVKQVYPVIATARSAAYDEEKYDVYTARDGTVHYNLRNYNDRHRTRTGTSANTGTTEHSRSGGSQIILSSDDLARYDIPEAEEFSDDFNPFTEEFDWICLDCGAELMDEDVDAWTCPRCSGEIVCINEEISSGTTMYGSKGDADGNV